MSRDRRFIEDNGGEGVEMDEKGDEGWKGKEGITTYKCDGGPADF